METLESSSEKGGISLQNSDIQYAFHESTGIKQHEWENSKQKTKFLHGGHFLPILSSCYKDVHVFADLAVRKLRSEKMS